MADNLFAKMVRGEIPVEKVYEDDWVIALRDIAPAAPVHVLVLPRADIESVAALTPEHRELAGAVLLACGEIARKLGIEQSGYRVILNTGSDAGQTVPHLHAHLLGGRPLGELVP